MLSVSLNKTFPLFLSSFSLQVDTQQPISFRAGVSLNIHPFIHSFIHSLRRQPYNLQRVARILKSLGALGRERYQAPLLDFLIDEGAKNTTLNRHDLMVCSTFLVALIKDRKTKKRLLKKSLKHFEI